MLSFRAPSEKEKTALLMHYASQIDGDVTEAIEHLGENLDSCLVGVCDNYMPDGPGYCGRLMVVVWPGGAEMVNSYGFGPDGTLYTQQELDDLPPQTSSGMQDLLEEILAMFPEADPDSEVYDSGINGGDVVDYICNVVPRIKECLQNARKAHR